MKNLWVVALTAFLGLISSTSAIADNENGSGDWKDNFRAGGKEATIGGFAYFSPVLGLSGRPGINYMGAFGQLGYMFHDPADYGGWSGNFEGLVEGFASGIFKGHGDYMAGSTLWLRYNFLPEVWRVSPYFQAGAGITLTDADREVLGQTFNFNLNVGLGVRYFINSCCSINAEARYQHVSNAGMSEANLGIDSAAGVLSVSWFF